MFSLKFVFYTELFYNAIVNEYSSSEYIVFSFLFFNDFIFP